MLGGASGSKRDGRASRRGRGASPAAAPGAGQRAAKPGRRGAGSIFAGTQGGTFDAKKARVSVPAPFRAVLARLNAEEVVLRKSTHSPCIEVWPKPTFDEEVNRRIADLDPFDPSYEKLSRKLVARIHVLRPDAEGRMVLPKELIEKAQLDGEIAYSGRIRFFQIWNAARLAEAEAADEEDEA